MENPRIALFANTDWYLYNFRLPLAKRLQHECGAEVWVICPDGPYRPRLEAEGFHWRPIRMERQGLNPFNDLLTAARLAWELVYIKPLLLHNFTLKSILAGSIAARFAGVPAVVNAVTGLGSMFVSGADRYRLPRHLLVAFFRWSFRDRKIRTIFQNEGDLEQFAPAASHQVRCRLIGGSGVDSERFYPATHPPDHPTLLLTARLLKDKGISEFCEAAKIVGRSYPNAEFLVAGSIDTGNPGSYSQQEIEELRRLFPCVKFLGHQEEMQFLYQRATLAVLPSRYREGVPRSLIEAACSGLPLVAVDGGGVRTIVKDGINGRLIPSGDSAALAHVLLALLGDPPSMERFGRASRALAVESFDQQRVLDATFAVYRELGFPPHT